MLEWLNNILYRSLQICWKISLEWYMIYDKQRNDHSNLMFENMQPKKKV